MRYHAGHERRLGTPMNCVVCGEDRQGFACTSCTAVVCPACQAHLPAPPAVSAWQRVFGPTPRTGGSPRGGYLASPPGCAVCGQVPPRGLSRLWRPAEWRWCESCRLQLCPRCVQAHRVRVKELWIDPHCPGCGRLLRRAVEAFPGGERVALVGQGGLSHWVGTARMGDINVDWDRYVLDLLAAGRAEEIAGWSRAAIEVAGNGAHEIRSWLTLAGAMAGRPAEVLAYEPVVAFVTGMGVVRYSP